MISPSVEKILGYPAEEFNAEKIDQVTLTRDHVHQMMLKLKGYSLAETKTIPMMDPMRADVILAGAMILWRVMERFGFSETRVSTRGLRFGVLHSI